MTKFDFNNKTWVSIFIIIAFLFGVVCRLYWVSWASEFSEMKFNDIVMINTNDGYAFAEGARDIIAGFHQPNDLSYVDHSMSKFTAFVAKIVPFEFESVILYMSVVLSSLLVVPLLLISKEFKALPAGIIASFTSVIANSYYNRTMAGYYDTDMLNIVLPCFVLWGLIRASLKEKPCIIAPLFVLISLWWYPSSFTLNLALLGTFFLYTLVFQRKVLANYQNIILFLVSLINIAIFIKFIAILALCFIFKKGISFKKSAIIGGVVFVIFAILGGLNSVFFNLQFYILRDLSEIKTTNYIFFNVNQTIQESGIIDYDYFMDRISSEAALFFLSVLGYILLCFKNRAFLLSLPILGLGFLALKAGLRFTIYAVPIMGLGLGYFLYFIVKSFKFKDGLNIIISFILAILCCIPAILHIKEYKSPTVFFSPEVEVLNNLKNIANREDYALAWWDYGYPIRYYSDVKTLIDGGKHLGNQNFPVSFALFKDEVSSANMARLIVEYTEKQYKEKFPNILDQILKDYNFKDVDDLLLSLSFRDFTLPKKTRDVYYYLPKRMSNIFDTVILFSNLDLKTGKSKNKPFFNTSYAVSGSADGILLNNGVVLSPDLKTLKLADQSFNIKTFYEVENKDGKFSKNVTHLNKDGFLSLILVKDDGVFIILDDEALKSSYVQLFYLENYDEKLFEPVILTPLAKVYKLKI
ncbi:STT3 domain-containing protein [Campylobacter ureolyticus]|uniref:General glycosylation pathway protein n=1 Tax=Campylobacter ureolyticus TaxID=827 RepID=A0A9Q4KKF2_9BACT|nr:STT3 domain-containing protein [Campylobacter ureolyticus]MCZ6159239.1 general glycosylation pathway protein [Campylobacter ureolyticus]MCZ6162745.1 general glycosylation pathway protein [Campylobacter ureolyticus]MCZ6164762.1 general glycosylation pathway protein [Campylobacter ureolyticus]MCZ6166559.1 general glycosylation pathway protein [Campylobacter ureolyticus]